MSFDLLGVNGCALGWLWLMRLYSRKRPGKHPMLFAGYKTRHMLLATFAGVRGAITLAGCFLSRYCCRMAHLSRALLCWYFSPQV